MKSLKTHKLSRFVSLFLCFALSPVLLPAKDVDLKTAQKVAINAFSERSGLSKSSVTISETIPVEKDGEVVFRVFNLNSNGFIIISAEDNALPVLGYGTDGKFRFDDAPPGLLFLLDGYKKEIKTIKEKKLQADENISKKWVQYSSDDYLSLKSYTIGSYLLETIWNQDSPYNNSCPLDPNTGLRCLVGCGAVALGQILNYWECKVFPDGTRPPYYPNIYFTNPITVNFYDQHYNWNNIRTVPSATAQFLYHCGVAILSNYTDSATSSNIGHVEDALKINFGFQTSGIKWKDANQSTWINTLKSDIDAGRPIFYQGTDTAPDPDASHAWVVDGYNSNNEFHCNWGWGSGYNNFCTLSYLNPHNTINNYSTDQIAILGAAPVLDACSGLSGNDIVCSSNSSYSVSVPSTASIVWSKSGNLTQVGGNTGTTYTVHQTNVQDAASSITATIKNSQGQTFLTRTKNVTAGSSQPGTISIDMNAPPDRFTASIQGILSATSYNWYIDGVMNNTYHGCLAVFNRKDPLCGTEYDIQVEAVNPCGLSEKTFMPVFEPDCFYRLQLSPNPTTTESTVELVSVSGAAIDLNTEWELEIYDSMQGMKEKKTNLKTVQTKVNTSSWKDGVYIVRAKIGEKMVSDKLVVKH